MADLGASRFILNTFMRSRDFLISRVPRRNGLSAVLLLLEIFILIRGIVSTFLHCMDIRAYQIAVTDRQFSVAIGWHALTPRRLSSAFEAQDNHLSFAEYDETCFDRSVSLTRGERIYALVSLPLSLGSAPRESSPNKSMVSRGSGRCWKRIWIRT